MLGEYAFVNAKLDVACNENDIAVLEPEFVVPLDQIEIILFWHGSV